MYAILDELPADARVPFALRFIEGMALDEVAAACDVSLSTAKRRLRRAEERFMKIAAGYPELAEWLEGASR